MRHHNKIYYEYQQDKINGITKKEYAALFDFLKSTQKKEILDLCGGTGELTVKLQNAGFHVTLLDIDEQLLSVAKRKGVKKIKKIDLLVNPLPKSEIIIMKSAQHEFKRSYLSKIHLKIFESLPCGGIYLDWDVHVKNKEQAAFLLKLVNIKDSLAGDTHLVKNRHMYSVDEIEASLKKTGFRKIRIIHNFFYSISVQKFARFYFKNEKGKVDEKSKIDFYKKIIMLIRKGVPQGVTYIINESTKNISFKFPAVILKAEK